VSPTPAADDVLLAVPNVSEGRDPAVIARIGAAFASTGARLLDVHSDPDHHRTVYTLAGGTQDLWPALVAGARECLESIDLREERGSHPHVGALAGGRSRAELRRGGIGALSQRVNGGELRPDFGPHAVDPRHGAVMVAARPPLIAFNVELAPPATLADAQAIAARIRDGGVQGLPGVRAIGVELAARDAVAQVSVNVEDHLAVPLATLVGAVAEHADVAACELVGLAPAAAFAGFPDDIPVRNRRTLEAALAD
jgi:glutamate formiminotransferase